MMSTQEVADKWAEYCRSEQWDKALAELYADNCICVEMEGAMGSPAKVVGLEAIKRKAKKWNEMVEALHRLEIEGPVVAGDHFTAAIKMDIKLEGLPRRTDEEIAVFKVENGKVVSEQFFYP